MHLFILAKAKAVVRGVADTWDGCARRRILLIQFVRLSRAELSHPGRWWWRPSSGLIVPMAEPRPIYVFTSHLPYGMCVCVRVSTCNPRALSLPRKLLGRRQAPLEAGPGYMPTYRGVVGRIWSDRRDTRSLCLILSTRGVNCNECSNGGGLESDRRNRAHRSCSFL